MTVKKAMMTSFAMIGLLVLTACTGPEGPMGPAGVDGAGTQVTYIFDITPAAATGLYTTPTISELVTDSVAEDFSTVVCYVRQSDGIGTYDTDSFMLPFSDSEENYSFTIEAGKVNLNWSCTTTPAAFEFIVTIINN